MISENAVHILVSLVVLSCAAIPSPAQISFSSAIDLALQNNPRVKIAHDDVNKALAALAETKDVYVPSVTGSGGLPGAFYGISTTVPTIFTISAQSLAFNSSQRNYIRAATMSLDSSRLALKDASQQVEEDTAITYLSLDSVLHQHTGMADEYSFSTKLVAVVQDRLNAGLENQLELKKSRRTSVQIKLLQLQLEDELASLRQHLGKLIGLPSDQLMTVPDSIPGNLVAGPSASLFSASYPDSPAILSAEANAEAKQEQAFGDSRYAGRPQNECSKPSTDGSAHSTTSPNSTISTATTTRCRWESKSSSRSWTKHIERKKENHRQRQCTPYTKSSFSEISKARAA